MKRARRLRELIGQPTIGVLPGAYDALSARLIESTGHDGIYFSGGLSSSAFPGFPDFGVRTLTEAAAQVAGAAQATSLPILADGEAGYGSVLSVRRTVREFERAGAAGLHLEDQDVPRRCGHYQGKKLVSWREHVGRIKAAVAAREDPDFVIIARTDAISVTGLADAIGRARAYIDAGADMVFFDGVESRDQLEQIPLEMSGSHVLANMVEGGLTPFLSAKELEVLGYSLVIYPCTAYFAALAAMREVLAVLRATGTSKSEWPRLATFKDWQEITGVDEALALLDLFGGDSNDRT